MYETLTHYIHFITYFSQLSKSIDYNDLVHRDGLYYDKFTDEPFTGYVSGNHYNGHLKDGKFEGEWLFFYDNGQLYWRCNYKDGKKVGRHYSYREDGKLEKTEIWKGDTLIDTIKH